MPLPDSHRLGRAGEDHVAAYLQSQGYTVHRSRYRTTRGEVDWIVSKGGWLVFVEVKARRSFAFGGPIEAVNPLKLHRLYQVAHHYLARYNWAGDWRIDVVGVTFSRSGAVLSLEHLQDVTS